MISFKEFINKSEELGNYISVDVADFTEPQKATLAFLDTMSGKATPNLHCTIVYSPTTSVPPETIQSYLDFHYANSDFPKTARIVDVKKFDAPQDADGNRPDAATLVLALESEYLETLHKVLVKEFDLVHTYDKLSPHVSIRYNISHKDCEEAMKRLKGMIGVRSLSGLNTVTMTALRSAKIIKDWANK